MLTRSGHWAWHRPACIAFGLAFAGLVSATAGEVASEARGGISTYSGRSALQATARITIPTITTNKLAGSPARPPVGGLFLGGHLLGLKIGSRPGQVQRLWGPPLLRKVGTSSYTLGYRGIRLSFTRITPSSDPMLSTIEVTSRRFRTPRGIRVGMPIARIYRAYKQATAQGTTVYFVNGPGLYEGALVRGGRVRALFVHADF